MTLTLEDKKTAPKKYYNLEGFFAWIHENAQSDTQYELINGEIVERNAAGPDGPSGKHGEVIARLTSALVVFAESNDLGRVFSTAPCLLPEQLQENDKGKKKRASYLIPDIAFYVKSRIPDKFAGAIPAVPDLVVEVNSPSDDGEHIKAKIELYQKAGVRLIWSIYMMEEFVVIYRLGEPDKKFLNLKDDLVGEDLLPNFAVNVAKLLK